MGTAEPAVVIPKASVEEKAELKQSLMPEGLLNRMNREDILDLDKSLALLPDIVAHLDEPLGDGSLLPTYLLSSFTRRHVTVALGYRVRRTNTRESLVFPFYLLRGETP